MDNKNEAYNFNYEKLRDPGESRFGNREKIYELMNGPVVERGPIEDLIEDVPDHTHEVNIIEMAANQLEYIKMKNEDGSVYGVFKPVEGEDHADWSVPAFYSREKSNEEVIRFFDENLVPPTEIRKVNGRLGSVQFFVPREYFKMASDKGYSAKEAEGDDFYLVSVLDAACKQSDRKTDNFLFNHRNPKEIILIDNASSFEDDYYNGCAIGPQEEVTADINPKYSYEANTNEPYLLPKTVEIPANILAIMQDRLERKEELNEKLRQVKRTCEWKKDEEGNTRLETLPEPVQDLSEEQIAGFWQRIEEMVQHKVFISAENRELVLNSKNE